MECSPSSTRIIKTVAVNGIGNASVNAETKKLFPAISSEAGTLLVADAYNRHGVNMARVILTA